MDEVENKRNGMHSHAQRMNEMEWRQSSFKIILCPVDENTTTEHTNKNIRYASFVFIFFFFLNIKLNLFFLFFFFFFLKNKMMIRFNCVDHLIIKCLRKKMLLFLDPFFLLLLLLRDDRFLSFFSVHVQRK